ncbi:peroxidase family protein [Falsigemmobacter faecalis]|nr:peroxidase family protein [Falsigemmobacter faecalis]
MVTLIRHDLDFILRQIRVAEAHAAGTPLSDLVESPLLPWGLRTVDGSFNNLVAGREQWGASHEPFVQLTRPYWRNEGDDQMSFGTPADQIVLGNNNYDPNATTSPGFAPGTVVDADPRLISNLIVDQTLNNPAAVTAGLRLAGMAEADIPAALAAVQTAQVIVNGTTPGTQARAIAEAQRDALIGSYGISMDGPTVLLSNASPDEGLSAPYNGWFTLFGQFFDHGLDLVKKGGNGSVYIPLQPDDPLYNPASPDTNFMVMTRATLGESATNVTTPWVDQNQTYTSHPSHQVFLRDYEAGPDGPLATGLLLDGARGMATWADVKTQARELLGIELTDLDVGAVPVLLTDPYGEFIRGPNGLPQILAAFDEAGMAIWVEGNLADPVNPSAIQLPVGTVLYGGNVIEAGETVSAARTGNAFLDDIAHAAVPVVAGGVLQPDDDATPGYSGGFTDRGAQTAYDNEMLDAHYITGDGRGNENIGLTALHYVFHAEHNRLVKEIRETVLATEDTAFIAEWQLADGSWDGERLFQAARFATEMQYQHLVFEEFARKVQPDIDIFVIEPDVELNPGIFAEFAHVVYRFGHSMLTERIDRIGADGSRDDMDLFDAFLNPLAFGSETVDHSAAAGVIVRGMTGQVGNEIDEFVTHVLRNQLVGIPLDLAALNIARGRDAGMPGLNDARAQFMEMAGGDTQLKPYESWVDFALNIRNPESVVNFIAAYGRHQLIEDETTVAGKRAAAMALVFGTAQSFWDGSAMRTINAPADRLDFLNARGSHAEERAGVDLIDLWVGGLAEKKMAFGGMLGSTFSFVFQMQLENLQHGDRLYYLSRLQGTNLLNEMENNSLASIVMRNTDLGETGFALPGDIFSTPDHVLYVDAAKQAAFGYADPTHDNPLLQAVSALVERGPNFIRYNGLDHTVIAGTEGNDTIIAGGGDDAIRGFGGDDNIEAGYGVDIVYGGDGDDVITNSGTDIGETDMIRGDGGNDVIHGGSGLALLFGGDGKDFLMVGPDGGEARGGNGDDFISGGSGVDALFGNAGDDWIEGGGLFDYIAGDHGDIFFNSTEIGHDVINGGRGDTDYDADSGDDIMIGGEGIQKFIGMWGFDWVSFKGQAVGAEADMNTPVFATLPLEVLRDRFSQVEALSGWKYDDVLRGDDRSADGGAVGLADPTPEGNFLYNELDLEGIARISGLDQLILPELMSMGQYWADGSGSQKMIFTGGNILLGGGGSDLIEGRGGNDVIDGDAWLNTRIAILGESGQQIATAESMMGPVTDNTGQTLHNGRPLSSLMLERVYNPGQLQIVREILWDDSGTDTALYWDDLANYELTQNADGSITVSHIDVPDGVINPATGRAFIDDGTDRLYNIEYLQFADQRINVGQFFNDPPVGLPLISDTTPTQNAALQVDLAGVSDADGISPGSVALQWQVLLAGNWSDIPGATGASFTPGIGQVNTQLRVVMRYTDGFGNPETVTSDPTGIVGVELIGTAMANVMDGTAGSDAIYGRGGNDTISGFGGDDVLNGEGGSDVLFGGAGNDTLDGGDGADVLSGGEGDDLLYGGAGIDLLQGDGGNDTLEGGGGADTLSGGEGDDLLYGGAGIDLLQGDGGNDTLEGGGGADTLSGGEGDDLLYGGAGIDLLQGDGGNDTLEGGGGADTLSGGEGDDLLYGGAGIDLLQGDGGNDTLEGGDSADTLSGGEGDDLLYGGAGVDLLQGDGGNDTLEGGAANDVVEGGAGDDLLIWRAGDGRDVMRGGSGTDTVRLYGDASNEAYHIWTVAAWRAFSGANNTAGGLDPDAEILITRNGTNFASIVAQLSGIEEIHIDGVGGNDTFTPHGDFSPTSLSHNTIRFTGSTGNDRVDMTQLLSAHRVVFDGKGGDDSIIGTLRPQDVYIDGDGVGTQGQAGDGQDVSAAEAEAEAAAEAGEAEATHTTNVLAGSAADDILSGSEAGDLISGGAGDDLIRGKGGDDVALGGAGSDTLLGDGGNDSLFGQDGDDYLFGNDGEDVLSGGAGDDHLFGGAGDDLFLAGVNDGNDVYFGDAGSDTLDMSAITAAIRVDLDLGTASSAQSGQDILRGIENVTTGQGNDLLIAGNGLNILTGGAGDDTFCFRSAAAADGDVITDFAPGDRIDLSGIDANAELAGRQSFTLVTGDALTGPGQLLVTQETRADGTYTVIAGSTEDAEPAFRIHLKGAHELTAGDFTL